MTQNRQLTWDGCNNVRDLGGLPASDGRRTRWGAPVRSDAPSRLTAEGWQALWAHGIRTIITLRTAGHSEQELDLPTADISAGKLLLLQLNLLFGALYLPWQIIHLRFLRANARQRLIEEGPTQKVSGDMLMKGLQRALHLRNPSSEARAWGGWVGAVWMTAYWATLMPLWVFLIVKGV